MSAHRETSVRAPTGVGLPPGEAGPEHGKFRVYSLIPSELRGAHRAVVQRAQMAGAASLVLTGSAARGCRTEISDLDYHLVGALIETADLSREIDLHALSTEDLDARLRSGDDFVQWSLRFGVVLFDEGPWQAAAEKMHQQSLWPDAERKRRHAARSLDLARRFVTTGDVDGATVQVRTALSLATRAYLLGIGTFPLARAELPGQLREAGQDVAAWALDALIAAAPSLEELDRSVTLGEALLA